MMDPSPLPKLLNEIFEWISETDFPIGLRTLGIQIPWTPPQLHIIHEYVSKLGVDSDFSLRMHTKWSLNEVWQGRFDQQSYENVSRMVAAFVQDLGELFKLPKVDQQLPSSEENSSSNLKKNELVEIFIGFLIQIQQHGRNSALMDSQVMEEMRSLIAILGDTPFQATEDKRVQNIWAEFERLANEAGRLVHSFVFVPDQISGEMMKDSLVVLSESIELLKGHIVEFSNSLPNIATSRADYLVDSLFVVHSLANDLEDLLNRDDDQIVEIKDQIKVLHQGLVSSKSLIRDISLETNELEQPMMQIRDVAYEAEYLINSFLVGDVPLWYLVIRLNHIIDNIKPIETSLQETKARYDIVALQMEEESVQPPPEQDMKISKVDDIIVGFEEHESNVLDLLMRGSEQRQIVTIFGMPGIGKTTLAKKLYNHVLGSRHFDRSAWCVVSKMYHKKNILIDILICVGSSLDKDLLLNMDEYYLTNEIYKGLLGQRYLIVMDDVWDSKVWEDLQMFFPADDENGSRIVFTSRIKDVGPSDSIGYEIPILSNDQCWELLEKKVFHSHRCPPKLEELGRKIAKKCCGLPLAVVVMAGILSSMEESMWENVWRSLGSYFLDDQNGLVMRIMELSYEHLPQHLKPCFLFLGVFKEDTKIPVKKLTQLWVAEGFIETEENKSAESIAEEYLMELVDKSLVIVAEKRSRGGAKACIVHDLLHDFCLQLAEGKSFLNFMYHDYSLYSQKYQHLCVKIYPVDEPTFESLVLYGPRFRSLFVALPDVSLYLLNMKLLRVLDSQTTWFADYSLAGTEVLVHLRYLAINRLPASIDRNFNLEFLIVDEPVHLSAKIQKMAKLRFLSSREIVFDKDCDTVQTSNLEFLATVKICNREDEEMLKYFPHLGKLKCNYSMKWEENGVDPCPDFGFLSKCAALKVTTFLSRGVADIAFPSNVKKLTLVGLRLSWEKMSMIGELPKLEVMKLGTAAFEGETWEPEDDEFQQLKFFKMEGLDLTVWNVSSDEHFPKLQRLILIDCSNLVEIPCEIGDIASLQVIQVGGRCQKSVVESGDEIRQQQKEKGNEELVVIIKAIEDEQNMLEDDASVEKNTLKRNQKWKRRKGKKKLKACAQSP